MDHSPAPWGDEEERASGQRDLNFGGTMVGQCDDEGDEGYRRRVSRDPMSHRIIEKRRRDRMNSCLADLSRLIPAEYLKRGRGRIEKTEIIEMAIRHMRHLQEQSQQPFLSLSHPTPPLTTSSSSSSPGSCSSSPAIAPISSHQDVCEIADECNGSMARMANSTGKESSMSEQYQLGFFECLSEALHFLIEVEGFPASGALCLSLDTHLRDHCASLLQGGPLSSSKTECSVEEESHFQMEMSQKKSFGHSNQDIPAASSEGEDLEPVIQVPDCHNGEVEQPRELRVMLTRNEQEMHRGEGASILTLPGDSGASYKFKSNIKRRFTAGLEKRRKFEESEARKCEEADNGITTITSLPPHAPHSSNSVHLSPQYSQMPSNVQQSEHTSSPRVPVFALHSEQSFYVPLMLDMDALTPHASLLSKSASALHPVTISVNFCSSGGVDECSNVERHNGIPLTTSRDFPCSMESSVIMDSQSKHNCRHWRPAESYISQ